MGFFSEIHSRLDEQSHSKPQNFEKYKIEIEKTKAYIKSKRKAFYKNNNTKDR